MADAYIVVLDVAADAVRALLFDSGARRVEGFAAQLPKRADAAADCLDEMHRLVEAAGFRIAAVVGRSENEVSAEDRKFWPAFAGAQWFAALPDGAGVMLGSGCLGRGRFALVLGDTSFVGTIVEGPGTAEGLTCTQIDEKRWMLVGSVAEAGAAYTSFRRSIKGSVDQYLETAAADDPKVAELDAVALRFREVYELLSREVGRPREVIACGGALLRSPCLLRRIAEAVGVAMTVSTEAEAVCRGAALWALERIGAIKDVRALPASIGTVFNLDTTTMNPELMERAARIRMLLMDVDGVLTDAKLYNVPGPDGKMFETKAFDAQDGIALQWLNWYGIETGVISGRVSPATEERARQVKMTHIYQGHIEKIPILEQICEKSGIPADAIAYIGDDLTDVVVMKRVSLGIAPANARAEVKKAAHFVTAGAGGAGAVREVCELLLKAQGKWAEILKKYEIE
jgi:3-deoxy-D-manno-octulosonate 8-phosphate phosphatase (KDO 8-P phosphatase)